MAVTWTKEQEQVIHLKNRNILVSAAAGSGKTAVLVERIIQLVTDEAHPVDIDRLLVVTFTNAAAAQMRERIGNALEKRLMTEPDNEHLQKQMTLLHNSKIMTIDSFCLFLIRNYFHCIDLDPSFRIGDENELKLMKQDVAAKVLEEAYAEGSEGFLEFVESYASGKSDEGIMDVVLQLYAFAMSYPRPYEWLKMCRDAYRISGLEELEQMFWIKDIFNQGRQLFQELLQELERAWKLCEDADGLAGYLVNISEEQEQLKALLACEGFSELCRQVQFLTFNRLKPAGKQADAEIKEEAKGIRDYAKKAVTDFAEKFLSSSPEQILQDLQFCAPQVDELVKLTSRFMEAFAEEKREKGIVDFSDLEHFALEILLDGQGRPTAVAREFSEFFEEIMIDEYQDSNQVQELLLTSMKKPERNNIFMVGDVKQSIYKFRLARPELFMEKLETYTEEESGAQKIILGKNFRSRPQVLNSINYIFSQIMQKELGNVAYGKDAALYPGADFLEEEEKEDSFCTELLLMDTGERGDAGESGRELEARAVAQKIRQITDPATGLRIMDSEQGGYRVAEWKDIVVLFRTMTGWAECFARIFEEMGIPTRTDSAVGFFSAMEVQTLLSSLHVLDNPRQDIPLAGMLKAPFFGFTNEDLARIRASYPKESLYDALLVCARQKEFKETNVSIRENQAFLPEIDDELSEKIKAFLERLAFFREQVMHNSVSRLLLLFLNQTHYLEMVEAMPGGQKRRANVLMLLEKAREYEKTSYHGLFHFLRYMEQIQKYEVDFGEADAFGEEQSLVRFMSIHKSKGLEFPIVFVAGLGKPFNQQDARSKLALHPDFGIGVEWIDARQRSRRPTLLKRYIQSQIQRENLGEELRVLYVAMTRAKEKLYLSAGVKDLEAIWKRHRELGNSKETLVPINRLSQAGSFLDWIWMALMRSSAMAKFADRQSLPFAGSFLASDFPGEFSVEWKTLPDIMGGEVENQVKERFRLEDFLKENRLESDQSGLEAILSFQYPYEKEREIPSTLSVSELKRRAFLVEEEEAAQELYQEEAVIPYIPEFMKEEKKIQGNVRGNAYHRAMECIEFGRIASYKDVEQVFQILEDQKKMSGEEIQLVSKTKVLDFCRSPLGRRMAKAEAAGRLFREQQFVMGLNPVEAGYGECSEPVLIQGIIDVYFEEEGQLVLLDYKTDWVEQEEELVKRYHTQLELYEKALVRATGKKVKERLIYSFHLEKTLSF